MIRFLGAISGAALAVVTLFLLVGVPQFDSRGENDSRDIVTLPRPTAPVEPVTSRTATVDTPPDAARAATTPENTPQSATADPQPPVPGADDTGEPPLPSPSASSANSAPPTAAENWYAFWSPFRSEIAASGFVNRLQSVTGLDYRVVRVKPGVYEVAFAYANDAEITANLAQIATATGIEFEDAP